MSIFHLLKLILIGYPVLMATIVLAIFVAGMKGREEYTLPAGCRTAFKLLFAPWYGFKTQEATTVGYCTVYTVPNPPEDLLIHEAMHRFQSLRESPGYSDQADLSVMMRLVGALIYGAKYMAEFVRHGYKNNNFEIEARKIAGQE